MRQTINGVMAKLIIDPRPFSSNPFADAPCTESIDRTQITPEGWMD